jgi:hypothetical protein
MGKEITVLNKAIKRGAEKARNLNKIMGQKTLVIKDEFVVSIDPDGVESNVKKVKFGKVKVEKRHYVIEANK